MNHQITWQQAVARLQENNLPFASFALQNDITLLISQHGGRIFGPFLSPESESIFWMNPAWADPAAFRRFLDSGDWNQGGDRVWIAPEIQFNIQDRTDFWGSYELPAQMDPGQYRLDQPAPDRWRLRMGLTLTAYNLASGQKQLSLERIIRPVADPLRHLPGYESLLAGVRFAGYEQAITLAETQADRIMSEAWSLVQLNPGGELLIPASPQVEYSDYFEPVDDSYQAFDGHHIRLKITGDRRYKVGYQAAHTFGRLAYCNQLAGEQAYLVVRNFFNNPAAPYIEEPPDQPGRRGRSIHVYNDGGGFGGFGELECNGQTIGGSTGRSVSVDQMVLWLYVGPPEQIQAIALHLIGARPSTS